MTEGPDPLPGFLAAALASAAATGLYFFFFQPLSGPGAIMASAENVTLAGFAFVAAFFIAGLHIVILAAPLHALLARDRPPGPIAILSCATLVGALPAALLFGGDDGDVTLFGAMGLIGGIAFLAFRRCTVGAGEKA